MIIIYICFKYCVSHLLLILFAIITVLYYVFNPDHVYRDECERSTNECRQSLSRAGQSHTSADPGTGPEEKAERQMASGQTFGFPEAALRLTVSANPLSLGVNAAMTTS